MSGATPSWSSPCFAIVGLLALTSCASPLAGRRAQTVAPGVVEITAAPGGSLGWSPKEQGSGYDPVRAFPYAELGARAGVVPRVDLQLRIDSLSVQTPEVSVAYQVLGDPTRNDFALTLGAGVQLDFGAFNEQERYLRHLVVPLQVLIDIPVTHSSAFVLGGRTLWVAAPQRSIADPESIELSHVFLHVATLGFQSDFGPALFIRPELAAGALVGEALVAPVVVGALSVGVRLDFRPAMSTSPAL